MPGAKRELKLLDNNLGCRCARQRVLPWTCAEDQATSPPGRRGHHYPPLRQPVCSSRSYPQVSGWSARGVPALQNGLVRQRREIRVDISALS